MKTRILTFSVSILFLTASAVLAIKPGGYEPAKDQAEVKAAADFAVQEEAKSKKNASLTLKEVVEAQKQIVAGTNYQLTLTVNKHGKDKTAKVVVFRGLDRHYELKSWQWVK